MKGNVQHLNYCRQLSAAIANKDIFICDGAKNIKDINTQILYSFATIGVAQKFIMPVNGNLIEDHELKGVRSFERIALPYNKFVLEFESEEDDSESMDKNIIIVNENDGDHILVTPWFYKKGYGKWCFFPSFMVPKDTKKAFERGDEKMLRLEYSESLSECISSDNEQIVAATHHVISNSLFALTSFLNAVSCKNVHVEKSPAKASKQGKKVKTALPFDDYHFLTVDVPGKSVVRGDGLGGSHRSPREHLRRGHIRRLESGPIWVNACVVNAGIGSKVGKSYLMRKAS